MLETLVKLEEELTGFHAWALSGDTLVAALDEGMRFRNQFDRFLLALIHQAELQGVAKTQGATGTGAWLRDRYRMWITDANRTVKLATWLHADGQQTGAAMAAGDLNTDQARVIAVAVNDLPTARRVEGEAFLVGQAQVLPPRELRLAGTHLCETIDPDGAEERRKPNASSGPSGAPSVAGRSR
jgi:hypothetical protein